MKIIYKYDTKGKLRTWGIETDGDRYRTIAGLRDGKKVTSEWTYVVGKNIGRSNETSPEEQTLLEVASKYENKLSREYHNTIEGAEGGSHFFKPMLAKTYKNFPLWVKSYAQPKLDGMRCIATAKGLFTRQGKRIISCPHIFEQLSEAFRENPNLILDGELYNHKLKDNFNKLMSLCKKQDPSVAELAESADKVQYHIYDCPSEAEKSFGDRFIYLRDEIFMEYELQDSIKLTHTKFFQGNPEDLKAYNNFHSKMISEGYEGTMHRLDSPYEQKRSGSLLKRKEFITEEFEVIELVEGQGNWGGVIKSVICKTKGGKTFGAGLKGTRDYALSLIGQTFKTATVRYFELTPDGVPRFGIVISLYEGDRDD